MNISAVMTAPRLAGALFLTWTEQRFPDTQEALIGCLFVLAASLALVLLGQNPHGGEHMKDLLAGQILWVLPSQLITVAALYAVLLAVWFTLKERLGRSGFYVVFALAVTASVQLVGVYLIFASLIMPALAARLLQGRARSSPVMPRGSWASQPVSCCLRCLIFPPARRSWRHWRLPRWRRQDACGTRCNRVWMPT